MIGAPNSLDLNCKVRVMKEAPGPSVSEEIADIFTNYNIDLPISYEEYTFAEYHWKSLALNHWVLFFKIMFNP